jgi:hypothetical protein
VSNDVFSELTWKYVARGGATPQKPEGRSFDSRSCQ